jgi:hypothetical protein
MPSLVELSERGILSISVLCEITELMQILL